MRDLVRTAWPMVVAALLVALLAGLRLVSKNAPRTSRRYRLRVALLAALVGLTGSTVLAGCGADEDPGQNQPTCYLPVFDVAAEADAGQLPDAATLCYVSVDGSSPDVDANQAPDENVMCYADVGPQEPDLGVLPEAAPPETVDARDGEEG